MFTLNHISGGEATGSHVTGSDVTRNVLRMRNSFPRFSPTIMTPKEVPLGSCMRNRKLCNIRPRGV
jgi:hypothetical protein